jgi:hypothetical protein
MGLGMRNHPRAGITRISPQVSLTIAITMEAIRQATNTTRL